MTKERDGVWQFKFWLNSIVIGHWLLWQQVRAVAWSDLSFFSLVRNKFWI